MSSDRCVYYNSYKKFFFTPKSKNKKSLWLSNLKFTKTGHSNATNYLSNFMIAPPLSDNSRLRIFFLVLIFLYKLT